MKYLVFMLFLALYMFLDNLGFQNYPLLISAFGWGLFLLTMTMNILISFVSAMTVDKIIQFNTGSSVGVGLGNIIGAVFAGCTSCGVSLLAVLGLNFTLPFVSPGAIEFKIIALIIVSLGYLYTNHRVKKGCKIK